MKYTVGSFKASDHHALCNMTENLLNDWSKDGFELENIQFSSVFNDLSKEIIFSVFMVGKKEEVKEFGIYPYRGYEKRRAEIGEKILIVNADPQEEQGYKNGDEFTVSVKYDSGMIETTCERLINDTEYVVIPKGENKND